MIDGYQMWCATDTESEYVSIRKLLGIEDNKTEEYYEEIFNLIEKYSSKYFVIEYIGCADTYELDHTRENSSTSFTLKCTSDKAAEPIKFVRKKRRSRRKEREVLNKVLDLKIRKEFIKEEE